MGRKILSKINLILISAIIISLIISLKNNYSIANYPLKEIVAITSIAMGIFSFVKEKIFSKHTKFYKWIYQILMISLGISIIIPSINNELNSINKFANIIIIGIYILVLLISANSTKNEKVSKSELKSAEEFLGKTNKTKKHKEEEIDFEELKKKIH